MGLSIWHLLIVLAVVLVIFGAGRLPGVMGDLGKGIRSFKAGLNSEDGKQKTEDRQQITEDKNQNKDS